MTTDHDPLTALGQLYRDEDGHEVWRLRDRDGRVAVEGIASDHDARWLATQLAAPQAATRSRVLTDSGVTVHAQCWDLDRIYGIDEAGQRVRLWVELHHDSSYPRQSHYRISRWDGTRWQLVLRRDPVSDAMTSLASAYLPRDTRTARIRADADRVAAGLLHDALAVLSDPTPAATHRLLSGSAGVARLLAGLTVRLRLKESPESGWEVRTICPVGRCTDPDTFPDADPHEATICPECLDTWLTDYDIEPVQP